jgi:hypothetical protein
MSASVIYNGNSISAFVDGKNYTANKSHPMWASILTAWRNKDWETFKECFDAGKALLKYSFGKVRVINGEVFYKNSPVHSTITKRIITFMQEGMPYQPYVKFLDRLYKNPLPSARNELYDFLEVGKMPITDDGCFLAWKKVDSDFRSFNANPDGSHNKHVIGKPVRMKRSEVDSDRNVTCSTGLHFCSYDYLNGYQGDDCKVIVVKVAPENVCAIPSDYNNTKGRCCEYVPMDVVGNWKNGNILTEKLYSSKVGKIKAYKPRRDENGRFIPAYRPKRDKNGRFAAKRR